MYARARALLSSINRPKPLTGFSGREPYPRNVTVQPTDDRGLGHSRTGYEFPSNSPSSFYRTGHRGRCGFILHVDFTSILLLPPSCPLDPVSLPLISHFIKYYNIYHKIINFYIYIYTYNYSDIYIRGITFI